MICVVLMVFLVSSIGMLLLIWNICLWLCVSSVLCRGWVWGLLLVLVMLLVLMVWLSVLRVLVLSRDRGWCVLGEYSRLSSLWFMIFCFVWKMVRICF